MPRHHLPDLAFAGLALCLTAGVCRAHDPGLSYADFRVSHGLLTAHLTFARRDIETLVPIDTDRDGKATAAELALVLAPLTELAGRALTVRLDEKAIPALSAALRLDDSDAVHIELAYPPPASRTLHFAVPLIAEMSRGHRQYVTVRTPQWTMLAEHLLDSRRVSFDFLLAGLPPPTESAGRSLRSSLQSGIASLGTAWKRLWSATRD